MKLRFIFPLLLLLTPSIFALNEYDRDCSEAFKAIIRSSDEELVEHLRINIRFHQGPLTMGTFTYRPQGWPPPAEKLEAQRKKAARVLDAFGKHLVRRGLSLSERRLFQFLVDKKVPLTWDLSNTEPFAEYDIDSPSVLFTNVARHHAAENSYQIFLHESQHIYDLFHSPHALLHVLNDHDRFVPGLVASELRANLMANNNDPEKAWKATQKGYAVVVRQLLTIEHPVPEEVYAPGGKAPRNWSSLYDGYHEKMGLTGQAGVEYALDFAMKQNVAIVKATERAKQLFGREYADWVEHQLAKTESLSEVYGSLKESNDPFDGIYLGTEGEKVSNLDTCAAWLALRCPIESVSKKAREILIQPATAAELHKAYLRVPSTTSEP